MFIFLGSVIPLIPFLMFALLPESPVWLAKRYKLIVYHLLAATPLEASRGT